LRLPAEVDVSGWTAPTRVAFLKAVFSRDTFAGDSNAKWHES